MATMNIREIVVAAAKYLLAGCFILSLSACQEDIALLDQSGALVGKGAVEAHANSASSINLSMNGKAFSGTWKTIKVYDQSDEKRYKLMGSRAYDSYLVGNAPDALKRVHAELTAQDGEEMKCDFYYRRQPGVGTCSIGGKSMTLAIQQIETGETGARSPSANSQQKGQQTTLPEVM